MPQNEALVVAHLARPSLRFAPMGEIEAAERGTRELRELIRDLVGPTFKELGEHFGDRIRLYRAKWAFRVARKAEAQIEASGLTRQPLSVRDTVMLLEGASLQDDDYLASRWAGLIASAATVGGVLPSYSDILLHLTSEEARMLDYLYEKALARSRGTNRPLIHIENKEDLQKLTGLDDAAFIVRIQNLHRLELIVEIDAHVLSRQPTRGMEGWRERGPTGLTALGSAFVRACRGPEPAA